ncbi:MAG: integrase [Beijerinckiaceae bacterium]|nr:integrase [Beijerinckiaceae bacterium]
MTNGLQRLLGGPPMAVLTKLVFLSIVVGAFLALLGLTPPDLFRGIRELINHVIDLGFGAIETVFRYFLYGAVLVVPVWLIMRLFRAG